MGAPELFVCHDGFASALATARCRGVKTRAGPFANEVALELPQRAENVKDEPSPWRRGVDRLGERAEADAAPVQGADRFDQMRQRAAETIELPYRQDIALTRKIQRRRQSGPLGFRSRGPVFENTNASGLGERVELQRQILLGRRDPCIADGRHFVSCRPQVRPRIYMSVNSSSKIRWRTG
jgi:hypothetical protein